MDSQIIDTIVKVLTPYNPAEISVFGSFAKGTFNKQSDIDVLVSFQSEITLFDIARIVNQFEKKYDLKIDLIEKEGLSDDFLVAIQKDLKSIYRDVHRSA